VSSANDNLRAVTCVIPRGPEVCWRILVDAAQLPAWVPGLRKAQVISTEPVGGLPAEIWFEYSTSLSYSLAYSYDAGTEIRWEPRTGKRDGVRGFARLEPVAGGTKLTYALEQGTGRSAAEVELGEVNAIVTAFSEWVCNHGPTGAAAAMSTV
jgi:hypothetical protein